MKANEKLQLMPTKYNSMGPHMKLKDGGSPQIWNK